MNVSSALNAPNKSPIYQSAPSKKESSDFDPTLFLPGEKPHSQGMDAWMSQGKHVVQLNIEGPLGQLNQPALLELAKNVYIKVCDEKLLFSLDEQKWGSFEEVFTFDTSFKMSIDEQNKIKDLGVFLNLKAQN